MDARPAPALKSACALVALCAAVACAGWLWSAWDMLGGTRRSMLQGWDDSFYYFWLPSTVIDHDVDFSNQIAQSDSMNADMREIAATLPRTATGLPENKYPPGWALGSLPFFLVAHAFTPTGSTGFEPAYLLATTLGQLLYATLGLWLAARLLARSFAPTLATVAVCLGWLASPLVYYQSARLTMSHSQVFALTMLVFWLTAKLRDADRRPRLWFALGFAAAMLLATRNVAVVYLLWPAWALRGLRPTPRELGALAAGAALPLAAQVLSWRLLYGSWLAYSYGGERFDFTHLHLREVLFSARHGWFYWHPLLLAGIGAFLPWAWRRAEGRAWLLSFALIVLLAAAWPTWWLGSSFGYRGFEVPVFFAMIGFAAIGQHISSQARGRRVWPTLAALAVAWNLALLAMFLTHRIPREDPVTYGDVVRNLMSHRTSEP